jgi:pectate lyase
MHFHRRTPARTLCSALSLTLGLSACSGSDASNDGSAVATGSSSGPSASASSGGNATTVAPIAPLPSPQPSTTGPAPVNTPPGPGTSGPMVPLDPPLPVGGAGGTSSGGTTGEDGGGNGGEPAVVAGSGGEPGSSGTSGAPPVGNGGGGSPNPPMGGAAGEGNGGMSSSEGGSGGDDGPPPGDAPCDVPDFVFEDTSPIGWASESGGTTGGGSAAPVLVTSFDQLQNEVEGSEAKVIYVQGDFSPGVLDIGSNKTIIGCSSGAHLHGAISIGSGSSNVILRNLEISGYAAGNCALDPDYDPGEGCSSGSDAVGVNGDAHHVWFDHCWVKDGTDGNLDVTNDADFVTVSWTRFSYTPRTDNEGADSTGAAGHRFSNLVGGTDTAPTGWPGTIPLNVTWHHNWWSENVVERQPRVRYGRNHLFNNLYDSNTSNYCVRAGIEASVLLEANYFDGVDTPHQFNGDDAATAFIARGDGDRANIYDGTTGEQAINGEGEGFTPPYSYSVDPAQDVPAMVRAGAGPQ